MAEVKYYWPARDEAKVIGKDYNRIDGLAKATGAAKYAFDINLENMLIAQALSCPHGHCRVKSIDTSAASSPSASADALSP